MITIKKSLNSISLLLICLLILTYTSGCSDEPEQILVSNLSPDSIIVEPSEIKKETSDLISNASKCIFIEQSIINDKEILDLIIKKAHEGIEIRILLDQWQRENQKTLENLKNENVSIQFYPAQKGQYQRIKFMVVDYNLAVFYGTNWTSDGFNSFAAAVKLTGDTAWSTTKLFNKDWNFTTTLDIEIPENNSLPEDNIYLATNSEVKQKIINNINLAQKEILIFVEQLSEEDTLNAIVEAKKRGCTVKVIIDSSCEVTTPTSIQTLKDSGIELKYYLDQNNKPLKLNMGLFDDNTLIISSSAWTHYSFIINHECSLVIPSPLTVTKLKDIFSNYWESDLVVNSLD